MRGLHHIGISLKPGRKYPQIPLKPNYTEDSEKTAETY